LSIDTFSGLNGQQLLTQLCAQKTNDSLDNPKKIPTAYKGPSEDDAKRIRNAIKAAKSLEEISELEKMLMVGIVPGESDIQR
jgi:hypothetical protein